MDLFQTIFKHLSYNLVLIISCMGDTTTAAQMGAPSAHSWPQRQESYESDTSGCDTTPPPPGLVRLIHPVCVITQNPVSALFSIF